MWLSTTPGLQIPQPFSTNNDLPMASRVCQTLTSKQGTQTQAIQTLQLSTVVIATSTRLANSHSLGLSLRLWIGWPSTQAWIRMTITCLSIPRIPNNTLISKKVRCSDLILWMMSCAPKLTCVTTRILIASSRFLRKAGSLSHPVRWTTLKECLNSCKD